ncbi:hypothetical protein RhiirC2_752436 [Rhizophagus irregularis]|uniref:Uncharacterized protein n=1 Tax=Rhizophagus irregularis TaxID=588596 RepID=A0A2N1MZH8_9GLOM|nr:hypothetical protein RhiirC2_752436 [Rhizophagus irregularis]
MLFEGAQETRQASKIIRICAKIDELLEQVQKDDVVEINLPDELGMNEADVHVLEAIHSIYIADRIGNKLLFKVKSNITCCVGRTELQPDVFFDRDPDRSNAINRINHCKRFRNGIEYVGIAIPETTRWHSNPAQASTAVVRQNNRPNQPPYGIY